MLEYKKAGDNMEKALYCINCSAEFSAEQFGEKLEQVIDYYFVLELKKELELLSKVEEMYRKYPESKNKMVPLREISKQTAPTNEEIEYWTKGNKPLADYLLTKSINIDARKKFVEKILEDEGLEPLLCPVCKKGIISFKDGKYKGFETKLSR